MRQLRLLPTISRLKRHLSDFHLNPHPEDIIQRWEVTLTGDDVETAEEVVDGRGVVVVRRPLRPEAVLQPDVVPQPLHRSQQVRRDVGGLLTGDERIRSKCQLGVRQVLHV